MSTKALSEAIRILRESYQEATGSSVIPGEVHAATRELEAIKRAARNLTENPGMVTPLVEVVNLMEAIAKEDT